MTVVVPDASVILKWVLQGPDESDSAQALAILEAYLAQLIDLRLPSLWRYEVANVMAIKQPTLAREAMETLLAYDLPEVSLDREYCFDVLSWMIERRGVSFYDAAYHVLAVRADGVYVTADRTYVGRAGRRKNVVWLSEWTAPGRRR